MGDGSVSKPLHAFNPRLKIAIIVSEGVRSMGWPILGEFTCDHSVFADKRECCRSLGDGSGGVPRCLFCVALKAFLRKECIKSLNLLGLAI